MFTVFDLETTGLSGSYCDVIQFSYATFEDNGDFIKSDCLYFYHKGMHWDEEVCQNVHHITLDFLEQFAEQFEENLVKMYTVLSKADVVGHNAIGFDCPFAAQWLMRMGLPGLTFSSIHDTMKMFQPMTKTAKVKLTKLSDLCGFKPEVIQKIEATWFANTSQAHNANYDVTATALLTLRAIHLGYVSFGNTTITSKLDVSDHKVCDGFYVKTTASCYHVTTTSVVEEQPIDQLTLPVILRAEGAFTYSIERNGNTLRLDIGSGECVLHLSGADINTMNMTMPIANFSRLLTNTFSERS